MISTFKMSQQFWKKVIVNPSGPGLIFLISNRTSLKNLKKKKKKTTCTGSVLLSKKKCRKNFFFFLEKINVFVSLDKA